MWIGHWKISSYRVLSFICKKWPRWLIGETPTETGGIPYRSPHWKSKKLNVDSGFLSAPPRLLDLMTLQTTWHRLILWMILHLVAYHSQLKISHWWRRNLAKCTLLWYICFWLILWAPPCNRMQITTRKEQRKFLLINIFTSRNTKT